MKKYLVFAAFFAVLGVAGIIKAEQGDFSTLGYNTPGGYSYWRVDSSGFFKPGAASVLDIGTAALPVRNIYVGGVVGATITSSVLTSPTITAPTITGAVTATSSVISASSVTVADLFRLPNRTLAQLALITPGLGDMYLCSDCVGASKVVYSTGTALHAFSVITDSDTYPN
jgi:hypothetical protein